MEQSGKEGVDGSSPSEGFRFHAGLRASVLRSDLTVVQSWCKSLA